MKQEMHQPLNFGLLEREISMPLKLLFLLAFEAQAVIYKGVRYAEPPQERSTTNSL